MAIKINQNIFSLLVQRNLNRTTDRLEKSYERISSGERINRSADDPAGLASSEQIRYEIRGSQQAQQNVNGAFSLIGTAESYQNTIVNDLQRARELLIQGSNETLNATDRSAIQAELDQILDSIEQTAAGAKFNDLNLLNGTARNIAIQIGTRSDEFISLTLPDCRTASLGSRAAIRSAVPVGTSLLADGAVSINGVAVPAGEHDGVSTVAGAASAIAKANALNRIEQSTGVHAEALPTVQSGVASIQTLNLNGTTRWLEINGIRIGAVTASAGDADGALAEAVNDLTGSTGVTASVVGGVLQLTAADGRNIQVRTSGSVADELGLATTDGDVDLTATGRIELSSSRAFTLSDAGGVIGLPGQRQVALDPATALQSVSALDVDSAEQSIKTIDAALAQISDSRSRIGALQNRLEGMVDTITKRIQDMQSADSRIRDTDFAFETAQLAQAEILRDAAIAMLSQANIAPQRALELLRPS